MKILLTIIAIILFAMPALAQERAHGFDEQARDAALLSALQGSDPFARRFQPRTSDPASPPNGTVWYRSDTDVVKVKLNSGVARRCRPATTTPGGSDTQVQFNDSSAFGGDAGFTYNKTTDTATLGALSLTNPLTVGNGGTGQTTYTNGQLLIGNTTGNTLAKATLTAGANVTVTNGTGSITIAAQPGSIGGWADSTTRTVAAASTQYNYANATSTPTFNSTEGNRQSIFPYSATISNAYIRTSGTQPNDGSLVCTFRNSTTAADSTFVVTVTANAVAGTFSDTTHSGTVSAGDLGTWKCVNASASASAGIFEIRYKITQN
jgi:hypothetical protein